MITIAIGTGTTTTRKYKMKAKVNERTSCRPTLPAARVPHRSPHISKSRALAGENTASPMMLTAVAGRVGSVRWLAMLKSNEPIRPPNPASIKLRGQP